MKLNSKWIVLVLALVGFSGCGGAVEFQSLITAPVDYQSGQGVTLDQVEKAIKRGGARRGWVISSAGPGHLVGTLHKRQHVLMVDITFDTKTYSIKYKDSSNLNYAKGFDGEEYLHNAAVGWMQNLKKDISREMFAM